MSDLEDRAMRIAMDALDKTDPTSGKAILLRDQIMKLIQREETIDLANMVYRVERLILFDHEWKQVAVLKPVEGNLVGTANQNARVQYAVTEFIDGAT